MTQSHATQNLPNVREIGRFSYVAGLITAAAVLSFVVTACNFKRAAPSLKRTPTGTPTFEQGMQLTDLQTAGASQRAVRCFLEAAQDFHSSHDLEKEATSYDHVGKLLLDQGQPGLAVPHLQQALSLHRATKSQSGDATALVLLGGAYRSVGRTHDALNFEQRALAIWRSLRDATKQGSTLQMVGWVLLDLDRPREAITASQQAVSLLNDGRNPASIAGAHLRMGSAYERLARPAEAFGSYQTSLAFAEQAGARIDQAHALLAITGWYLSRRQPSSALAAGLKALSVGEATGDLATLAPACLNIGEALRGLKQDRSALVYLRRSLIYSEKSSNRELQEHGLLELGDLQLFMSDYSNALLSYNRADSLLRFDGNRMGIVVLTSRIRICRQLMGAHPIPSKEDLQSYQRLLVTAKAEGDSGTETRALAALSSWYRGHGNPSAALALAKEALRTAKQTGNGLLLAHACADVARALRSQRLYQASEPYADLSLSLSQRIGDSDLEAQDYRELGDQYVQEHKYSDALSPYALAAAVLRRARRNADATAVDSRIRELVTRSAKG